MRIALVINGLKSTPYVGQLLSLPSSNAPLFTAVSLSRPTRLIV